MHAPSIPLVSRFPVLAPIAMLEFCLLPGWACDPFETQFEEIEGAVRYEPEEDSSPADVPDSLTVMTYNIKFGGGRVRFFFECPGDRVHLERAEVLENLTAVAEKIRQVDPDLLLLQEVDIESDRVAGVDQVQWLLDHTALEYAAYASQWRATYVPKRWLGYVNSGNAILSRWPFEEATRIALPLISTQGWLTRYFYLKRNLLKSRIDVPGFGELAVLNTHLSAFSTDGTRLRQLRRIETELAHLDERSQPFVFGGDLNLIPPGSETTRDFADERCEREDFEPTDYTDRESALEGLYDSYDAAVPLDRYRENNAPHFSYTGDPGVGWTRKLDYLFTNRRFREGSGLVHQGPEQGGMETLERSDHAPVTAELPTD